MTRYTIAREWGDLVFRPWVITTKREKMSSLTQALAWDSIPFELTEATPRFTIRRASVRATSRQPWTVKDAANPAYLSQHRTVELALAKVDRILRSEAGLPPRLDITTAEIMAEMERKR